MNKERHKFASLSEQDRKFILDLCARHHYSYVVERLKQPRSEGGLDIATSSSALCRFYTQHHADPAQRLLAQHATATTVRHEQESNAFLGAIASTIQARVYENLSRGKALADIHDDFKLLQKAQQLYLSDCKWRAQNPEESRAHYQEMVNRAASLPDYDFMTIADLAREPEELANFIAAHLSSFDRDVQETRERQMQVLAKKQQIMAQLEGLRAAREQSSQAPNLDASAAPSPATPSSPPDSERPTTTIPPDSSVIPPIPSNSTSATPTDSAAPTDPLSHETNRPAPITRIASKVGRNERCPCGSGKKYKTCCLPAPQLARAA